MDIATATTTPLLPADVQLREDAAVGAAIRRAFASRVGRGHIDLLICSPALPAADAWNVSVDGSVHMAAAGPDLAATVGDIVAALETAAES